MKNYNPVIIIGAGIAGLCTSFYLTKNNISHIIVTGTSVHETRLALDLVSQYPNYLSATAGIHPHAVDATSASWFEDLTLLARDSKVVALGEMGLDYYRNYTSRYKQQEVFDKQLELAKEVELPVFIHDRDSGNDVLDSLRKHRPKSCVVHCFTGSEKLLDAYLAEGYYKTAGKASASKFDKLFSK